MTTTELEEIVVKLTGDGSSFQKMMTQAVTQSKTAADAIKHAGDQISQIKNQMESFAKAAVSGLATLGLATSLKGAFSQFEEFERGQIRLGAIIRATGQSVDAVLPGYKKLATELADTGIASKGEITSLIQQSLRMGKTGDDLERMVRNSAAFAAITGESVEAGYSFARALETGNKHMLQHMLAGRGAHLTDQQLNDMIRNQLAGGFDVLSKLADTASAKISRLERAFKGVSLEVGGMVADAIKPLLDVAQGLVDQFTSLDPAVKTFVAQVVAGTFAFLGLGAAIATGIFLFQALGGSFIFNTAVQMVNTVGWTLWSSVVLVAKVTTAAFSLVFSFLTALLSSGTIGTVTSVLAWIAWSPAVLAAKVATWLMNTALTVLNVLTAAIPAIVGLAVAAFTAFIVVLGYTMVAGWAVAAAMGALGGVIGVLVSGGLTVLVTLIAGVAAAWTAASAAITGLVGVFKQFPSLFGQLTGIGELLGDWKRIILDIVNVAKHDLPLAWEMAKVAGQLAVYELSMLWPPFWTLIRTGFMALWEYVKGVSIVKFKEAYAEMSVSLQEKWGPIAKVMGDVLASALIGAGIKLRIYLEEHDPFGTNIGKITNLRLELAALERESAKAFGGEMTDKMKLREAEIAKVQESIILLEGAIRQMNKEGINGDARRLQMQDANVAHLAEYKEQLKLLTGQQLEDAKKVADAVDGGAAGRMATLTEMAKKVQEDLDKAVKAFGGDLNKALADPTVNMLKTQLDALKATMKVPEDPMKKYKNGMDHLLDTTKKVKDELHQIESTTLGSAEYGRRLYAYQEMLKTLPTHPTGAGGGPGAPWAGQPSPTGPPAGTSSLDGSTTKTNSLLTEIRDILAGKKAAKAAIGGGLGLIPANLGGVG